MLTELGTPDLLKMKVFWNKGSEWIISFMTSLLKFYQVTKIIK